MGKKMKTASSKKACINVNRGGKKINEETKKMLKVMFTILFLVGIIMLIGGLATFIARLFVDFSTIPVLEFIPIYVDWVLMVGGAILLVMAFWFFFRKKEVC